MSGAIRKSEAFALDPVEVLERARAIKLHPERFGQEYKDRIAREVQECKDRIAQVTAELGLDEKRRNRTDDNLRGVFG